jgi:hypothetical protein
MFELLLSEEELRLTIGLLNQLCSALGEFEFPALTGFPVERGRAMIEEMTKEARRAGLDLGGLALEAGHGA